MDKLSLDQHISSQFNRDLDQIKSQMLAMGGMVEKQLGDALMALESADSALAQHAIDEDDYIDEMERKIDENCATVIALRQPTATDLRLILVVSKSIRDLERMGDEAQKIAKMVLQLNSDNIAPRGYVEVRHIATGVRAMVNEALDAFARFDAQAAIATFAKDDQIDLDYKTALREQVSYMIEDPRTISRAINVLWILRALERIGDHAVNICEHVVYLVKGKDIRHGHRNDVDI